MCFAPQRHALFRHLKRQKWSDPLVFCAFLTWKCASRHNGVQFFMSHLPICLRTRRFSEPTFRPSGTTNHWKNTVNRDFPTFFAHLHLLSSDSFSSELSSSLCLCPALLFICPYCRKFSFSTSFDNIVKDMYLYIYIYTHNNSMIYIYILNNLNIHIDSYIYIYICILYPAIVGYCALASGCRSIIAAPCSAYLDHLVDFPQGFLQDILFNQKTSLMTFQYVSYICIFVYI